MGSVIGVQRVKGIVSRTRGRFLLCREIFTFAVSSLILAVETDQARIVRHLSQKLDILQGDLVDLVEPLARFCDQTIELKRKDIQKNHRLLLQRQIEKCKNLIISRLKNYHDHQ